MGVPVGSGAPSNGDGRLIVVTGPPGAGKSTTTRLLAGRFERSVLVERETFLKFVANGRIEPWLAEAGRQNDVVISASAAAAGRYAGGGFATVYDGILPPLLLSFFLEAAALSEMHFVVLLPPLERCLERVQSRSGHWFVNLGATTEMHDWFRAPTYEERHRIDDPAGEPEEVVAEIMRRLDAGELRYARATPTGDPAGEQDDG